MDLGEDALRPEWLSTHYLNTVVEGRKHGGERAFKSWIQTRTGGPVRVSYRAHCRNSWDKCEPVTRWLPLSGLEAASLAAQSA